MTQHPILIDVVSMSVAVLQLLPIALFLYTKQVNYLKIFIIWMALSWTNDALKYGSVSLFPTETVFRRPGGEHCGMLSYEPASSIFPFASERNPSNSPGFPSGHMSTTVFLLFALYYQSKKDGLIHGSKSQQLGLLLYALCIAWTRHAKKCHTWFQIGSGAILGMLFFYFAKFVL